MFRKQNDGLSVGQGLRVKWTKRSIVNGQMGVLSFLRMHQRFLVASVAAHRSAEFAKEGNRNAACAV